MITMDKVKMIVEKAFRELKDNDGSLFDCPPTCLDDEFYRGRKLHEVCINHKLAIYLKENILEIIGRTDLFVDIEFNKVGVNKKLFRPDIIIHNRKSDNDKVNFLVAECKKEGATTKDIEIDRNRIYEFMSNTTYEYTYGLLVIYGKEEIKGNLFHKKENEIKEETMVIS